jgi:predicted SAM-dependent methyltransferase/glycosyltransferase involved in cell wall biosynthesis
VYGVNEAAIVIAAYNEADNMVEVVARARPHGHVIVVDDASTDDTAELARQAGATVLRHATNTHIRQAFVDGFRYALKSKAKYVVQMDAGLSHDAEEIPRLLGALDGADMVIGSRCIEGGWLVRQPFRRRALSWAGSLLVRAATGTRTRDLTSGFKAYRRGVLEHLDRRGILDRLKARAFAFQFELSSCIHRAGFRIEEVPITYRATGSSLNRAVVLEALWIWMGMFWRRRLAWRNWMPKRLLRRVRCNVDLRVGERRLRRAATIRPCRIVIGASGCAPVGWTSTEAVLIDLLKPETWAKYFRKSSIDRMLAEHVWEHLSVNDGKRAARLCFEYLRSAGTLRVAVPDAHHPDPAYREHVRPNGTAAGAEDHQTLYTHRSLQEVFESAGFQVRLLEFFDEHGEFHYSDWDPSDGMIRRSARFDPRNLDGRLNYTSIILDAIKPVEAAPARGLGETGTAGGRGGRGLRGQHAHPAGVRGRLPPRPANGRAVRRPDGCRSEPRPG